MNRRTFGKMAAAARQDTSSIKTSKATSRGLIQKSIPQRPPTRRSPRSRSAPAARSCLLLLHDLQRAGPLLLLGVAGNDHPGAVGQPSARFHLLALAIRKTAAVSIAAVISRSFL